MAERVIRGGSDSNRGDLAVLVVATILILALAAFGDTPREALRWSRSDIAAGQWWRWFTGHLVHLDLPHAALNVAAALVLAGIFGRVYSWRRTLVVLLIGIAAIDAGLWWLVDIEWYVGLSGVLHAYAAAVVVRRIIDTGDFLAWGVAIFGLGKLAWENTSGALPLAAPGTIVVTDAHLFGVIGGMVAGLLLRTGAGGTSPGSE